MELLNIVVAALTLLAVLYVVFRSKGSEKGAEHLEKMIADEAERTRRENGVTTSAQLNQLQGFATQLQSFSINNDSKFETVRKTLTEQLQELRVENSQKLEEMNKTVNEKLHTVCLLYTSPSPRDS